MDIAITDQFELESDFLNRRRHSQLSIDVRFDGQKHAGLGHKEQHFLCHSEGFWQGAVNKSHVAFGQSE